MKNPIQFGELEKEYTLSGETAKSYLEAKLAPPIPVEKPYKRGVLTGAFDPYHFAHGIAIQRAANLCDQLVVAVSTDEVIRDYKHHEPFMPFEKRLQTISQIKGVTLAIPQYDLYDKLEMLQDLGADVLFSCEEYQRSYYPDPDKMTDKEKAGVERWEKFEQEANSVGIDVVYLPRSNEMSSTSFKDLLAKQAGLQQPQGVMLYSEGESCDEDVFAL